MKSSFFGDCFIAMMFVINLLLCISILLPSDVACVGLTKIDDYEYNTGDANAGIVRTNTPQKTFTDESSGNIAVSVDGVANAGMIDTFDQGIYNQDYNIKNNANNNFATSIYNSAISGSDVTVGNVYSADFYEESTATNNEAFVSGNKANTPQTIASSGTLTRLGTFDNYVDYSEQTNTAVNNSATNRNKKNRGDANSGVNTAIEYFYSLDGVFDNEATNNQAKTMNGFSNSGVYVDIGEAYYVNTSMYSSTSDNVATTRKGDANAGVINNVDVIRRQYREGANIGADAYNNVATANDDGEAVAGFSLDIGTVKNNDLFVKSNASNNKATTSGKNSNAFDAVSGNKINIDNVEQLTLQQGYYYYYQFGDGYGTQIDIDLVAESNTAENNKKGTNNNDAISGNQVTVGNVQNSVFTVNGVANNNSAITRKGDAVSGNKNLKLVLRSFEIGQLAQQETAAINDSLFRQSLNSKQEKEHVAHVGHVQDNSADLLPVSIQAENSKLNPELDPPPEQNQTTFLDDSDIQLLEEPKILLSFLEAQGENSKSLYEQEFQTYQDMTGWRVPKTHTKQRIAKNQYEGIKTFNSFAPLDQLSQTTNFHISDSGCCQYDEEHGNRKALKFKLYQKKGRDKLDFLRYLSNYGLTEKDLL